ncbi:MAG: transglutaminase domain-containing protein [Methanobacterium sp.]
MIIAFLFLSIVNTSIFLFRSYFQYQPYANYASLYSSKPENLKKWENFIHDFPPKDLKEAKKITDSICKGTSSTYSKILLISSSIFRHSQDQIGKPTDVFSSLSPVSQYKQICTSKNEKLWCGNIARIFSFFCWSQGIICRYIEIMQPGDHHVLTECFLPEIQQWVMVDPTFNLLIIQDNEGKMLNLVDFREALKKSIPVFAFESNGVTIDKTIITNKTPAVLKYYNKENQLFYYQRTETREVYTNLNKVKRFIFPESWYAIYDSREHGNLLFYIKLVFISLLIVSFFALLVVYLKPKI